MLINSMSSLIKKLARFIFIIQHDFVRKINRFFQCRLADQEIAAGTVVSLTSHKRRILGIHETIRSILDGDVLPEKIALILHKSDERFVTRNRQLMRLNRESFVEIHYVDVDYKSYKKIIKTKELYPAFKWIITIDDDVYYNRSLLKNFFDAQTQAETEKIVFCNYARNNCFVNDIPYAEWPIAKNNDGHTEILAIGVGGIMYPIDIMVGFDKWDVITGIAPNQDDLWMNIVAKSKGYKIKLLNHPLGHPRSTYNGYRETGLYRSNKTDNIIVYKNLMKLYSKW